MSLEVYFDNTLIDEQYYSGLNNNNELFSENFKLGATPSNTFKLTIRKDGVSTQPTTVTLKDNNTTFAILKVDNIEEEEYEYVYTLTDSMLDLEFYYDASLIFVEGSTTLLNIVQDICLKAGIALGTTNFRGYNKAITWYDNRRTAREYISYIAELNGGYAQIGQDGRLYFIKQNTSSVKTISIDNCEDFKLGEYHKITRVVYELGATKYEYGDSTGNTLYLNSDNVFITTQNEVQAIYNDIRNFEFYSFTTGNCPVDYSVKAGEIITFSDGTNNYKTIAQYDLDYFGGWYGGYSLDINTERQEESTQVIGLSNKVKNLAITVDRDTNTIIQAVEEIDEQNTKISVLTQKVGELESQISDVADLTVTAETIYASVDLDNINESEPVFVKIRPVVNNISYLYPRNNLYPSNDLYMPIRTLRFKNTTTDEIFDYELPDNLLYYDSENYDEFTLDYENQLITVVKKCKYNADGTVGLLSTPVATNYPYPRINLTAGDYTIELLTYDSAYLLVRLMVSNLYTDQFATKAELNSKITQTSEEITASVNQTLTNYATTEEMNSAINISADNITSSVSRNYSTKVETENAKEQAINSANTSTDTKLEQYPTTVQMNTAINQSANNITSTVSETYITKTASATNINTAKEQAINSANSSTDTKLQSYSTTTQMNSAINQKANEITLETNKKMENYALANYIANGNFENSLNHWEYDGFAFTVPYKGYTYCNLEAMANTSWISQDISSSGIFENTKYILSFDVFDRLTNLPITGNGTVNVRIDEFVKTSEEAINILTQNISVNGTEKTVTIEFTLSIKPTDLIITFSLIPNANLNKTLSLMIGNIVLKSSNITENIAKLNIGVDEISSTVSQKVGNNEVISKINQSSEAVTILANKLGLTANDVFNIIAGNQLNLTSKNIAINSTNFQVDKNGNMTCNNGTFTGGNVNLVDNGLGAYEGKLKIQSNTFINGLYSEGVVIRKIGSSPDSISNPSIFLIMYDNEPRFEMRGINNSIISISKNQLYYNSNNDNYFYVDGTNRQIGANTGTFYLHGNLNVTGSKNRVVKITNGNSVLLNAYETATPYFGDIGSNKTNENGFAK